MGLDATADRLLRIVEQQGELILTLCDEIAELRGRGPARAHSAPPPGLPDDPRLSINAAPPPPPAQPPYEPPAAPPQHGAQHGSARQWGEPNYVTRRVSTAPNYVAKPPKPMAAPPAAVQTAPPGVTGPNYVDPPPKREPTQGPVHAKGSLRVEISHKPGPQQVSAMQPAGPTGVMDIETARARAAQGDAQAAALLQQMTAAELGDEAEPDAAQQG